MTETLSAFRALHSQPAAFVIPNPWDTGSARILAALGFPALATTSAGMAFSMGLREGMASRDAVLAHCREIVTATNLPVSADLEHGFGHSPESAAKTIVAAAETGLAGASLEDHTGDPDAPIYDFSLAVERITAAVEACRALQDDFVFTARCENLLWGRDDLDDTIKRLQAFEAAGADVLYAPGLTDLASIRLVCDSLSKPVNVVMGMPGRTFSVADLSAAGVKRISVGSALARLAYGTLVRAARDMAQNGTFDFADDAMGFKELEQHFPETATDADLP
ncbi:2-methylisocitrate lyase [Sulfitobacter sp. JL08]|uniref:isocitrate lyase/PEP mutase family protein n=1 Tax=Sulfitobacter sp. JL08 TaxID=2070369 RepID=UPI000E0B7ABD|nr:isocitrate lyase/phosphoenolpyruvate mutase family protein [Sulfitobacter sp. JL08]AXI55356.1 2-methylisocitrate lyase [Sulfitobacter sp. JL08]